MLKEELRQTLSGIIFSNEDYKNKVIDKLLGGGRLSPALSGSFGEESLGQTSRNNIMF